MTGEIDDEKLMAFVDGRLDEPDLSKVAAAVEADPAIADRAEALATGSRLARAVYGPLADVPVPPPLEARIRAMTAATDAGKVVAFEPRRRALWPTLAGAAMAAGIAGLVFGFAGYQLGLDRPVTGEVLALPADVIDGLGRLPSGGTAMIGGAKLTAVSSFDNADGSLCREITVDGTESFAAVLCRTSGAWRVGLVVALSPSGEDFTPASAAGAIDGYLADIGAGEPLTGAEEAARLARPE